ncbi:uncharacterized protein BT62DRAFT_1000925 [Guyanagaster necrorhizus]|uniref:Uncharacterized protein n=1 Tax=Guyanagaster necrorhizus TaxID=856835 RepID=A0A9P7W3X8_9AGAR|nr:uncharacterized protein BT62DRAFT_1000925 [Guyanagaster necrorhizus MCA 3950]KAG7451664.1 hypothetical protein BT62DRAFT_1000925 [Guyanagaster necrorhizus MCA 3950]
MFCSTIDALTEQGYDLQFGANMLGAHILLSTLPQCITVTFLSQVSLLYPPSPPYIHIHLCIQPPIQTANHQYRVTKSHLHEQDGVVFSEQIRYGRVDHRAGTQICRSRDHRYLSNYSGTHDPSTITELFLIYSCTMLYPVEMGGLTQLYDATMSDSEALKCNGGYMKPWVRVGAVFAATKGEAVGRRLWEYLEEQIVGF